MFKEFIQSSEWQNTNKHTFNVFGYKLKAADLIPPDTKVTYSIYQYDEDSDDIKYYSFPESNKVIVEFKMPTFLQNKFLSADCIRSFQTYALLRFDTFEIELKSKHTGYCYNNVKGAVTKEGISVTYELSDYMTADRWLKELNPFGGHWISSKKYFINQ